MIFAVRASSVIPSITQSQPDVHHPPLVEREGVHGRAHGLSPAPGSPSERAAGASMSEIDLGGDDGPERLLCASARTPPPARPCEAARALARSKRPEAPKEKRIPRHKRLPRARSRASAHRYPRVHEAEMCVVRKSSRGVKKLARASPVVMEELRRGCDLASPSRRLAVAPAPLIRVRLIKVHSAL